MNYTKINNISWLDETKKKKRCKTTSRDISKYTGCLRFSDQTIKNQPPKVQNRMPHTMCISSVISSIQIQLIWTNFTQLLLCLDASQNAQQPHRDVIVVPLEKFFRQYFLALGPALLVTGFSLYASVVVQLNITDIANLLYGKERNLEKLVG